MHSNIWLQAPVTKQSIYCYCCVAIWLQAQPLMFEKVVRARPYALSIRMAVCERPGVVSFGGAGRAAHPPQQSRCNQDVIKMHFRCTQHALNMHSTCTQHALNMHSMSGMLARMLASSGAVLIYSVPVDQIMQTNRSNATRPSLIGVC